MAKVKHAHNFLNIKNFIGKKFTMKNFDEPLEVIGVKRSIPQFIGSRNRYVIYFKFRYSNKYETIEVWHRYDNVKKGQVRNYLKLGKYDTYFGKPLKNVKGSTSLNNIWLDMHSRCNDDEYRNRNYYGKVKVVEEWRVYQNFIKWVRSDKSNYDEKWTQEIDKDLFNWFVPPGEIRYYGPDTCVFLPKSLNRFLSSFTYKKKYGIKNKSTIHHKITFNGKSLSISNSGLFNNSNNLRYCKHYAFNAMINYYYNTYQINDRIYKQLKKINNFEYFIYNDKEILKFVPKETLDRINDMINHEVHKMRIRDKFIEDKDEVGPETSQLWSVII